VKLEGRVALITGASHGLGLATARALAAEGAAVACMARTGDALERAVATLRAAGHDAFAAPADVTSDAAVGAAVGQVLDARGRLDIVVLNAGTWKGAPLHETSEALWDELLDLNLKGAFLTLRHALPALIAARGGTIVGIDSLGGWVGQANGSAYAASKWGLRGLLESVALEVKPHGIRVSIVSPHNINSAGRELARDGTERIRFVEPEEVAAVVAFTCTAPAHVVLGNVTVWPLGAGIVARG
jgi:A-factor type gamma-butyrolactone 1'-reductase (1S-forming)